MGGIDSLLVEFGEQSATLTAFAKARIRRVSGVTLLVGAGDSYAAAMAGFFASNGRCIAMDPYSLAAAPETARGLEVYFISVSGRTASNVSAARKVKGIAKATGAVTAVEGSTLAGIVDGVIPLPMEYRPRKVGILSFSLSLLAVLRLAGRDESSDFRRALTNARKDVRSVGIGRGRGTTYLLGNSGGYAAALYTAAKIYEVLGTRAQAELLEEFSHLEVFSLAKHDQVYAFSCFDPGGVARKLAKTLGESGYAARVVPSRGSTFIESLFHSVFVGQLSVLEAASKRGLGEPGFAGSAQKLRTSDSMIY